MAKPGMSYTWRSILWGLDLLMEGIIWRVGTGEAIDAWDDPWLPSRTTRRLRTPSEIEEQVLVADFIDPVNGNWDEEVLRAILDPQDVVDILAIPLRPGSQDSVAWYYDKKGVFSVKSAYRLGVELREKQRGNV